MVCFPVALSPAAASPRTRSPWGRSALAPPVQLPRALGCSPPGALPDSVPWLDASCSANSQLAPLVGSEDASLLPRPSPCWCRPGFDHLGWAAWARGDPGPGAWSPLAAAGSAPGAAMCSRVPRGPTGGSTGASAPPDRGTGPAPGFQEPKGARNGSEASTVRSGKRFGPVLPVPCRCRTGAAGAMPVLRVLKHKTPETPPRRREEMGHGAQRSEDASPPAPGGLVPL